MSTQPIVIQVTDGVDAGIAGKIKAIGVAARQSANDLDNLNAAMGRLAGTQLGNALGKIAQGLNNMPNPARNAAGAVGQLEGGFARLLSRAVAAELGVGRLGGALGGLGVTAAGAGPIIIAALAIGTIVSAILVYDKFAKSARELTAAQTDIANETKRLDDRLLTQKETLIGLIDGPLAKYAAELSDLSKKHIDVTVADLNKELEAQKSHWADLIAFVQRYAVQIAALQGGNVASNAFTKTFDIQAAQDFINQQELTREKSADSLKGLTADIATVKSKLAELRELQGQEIGRNADATRVAADTIERYYDRLIERQKVYLADRKQLQIEADGDTLAGIREAAANQLRAFNEELTQLKQSGGIVTAQQELALRQAQIAGASRPSLIGPSQPAFELNQPKLATDVGNLTQEINKQDLSIKLLTDRYKNHVAAAGAYSAAQRVEAEFAKLITAEETKRIPITAELKQQLRDVATQGELDTRVNKEKVAVYNQFVEPLNLYKTALKAINDLSKEGVITEQQAAVARSQSLRTLNDSIDPLNEYKISLEHQVNLLGLYGKNLEIATEVDRVRQDLQKRGYDLDQRSIDLLTKQLSLVDQLRQIQSEENKQYNENAGALDRLTNQQLGLNKAYQDGVITIGQYKNQALETALAVNKLNNEITGGTLKSNVKQIYGELISEFRTLGNVSHQVTVSLEKDFSTFFKSLEKGFADSIGHALVFNESLSKALLDTARNAVAQLISSLIELGLQYIIVIALQKAFGISLPKQDDSQKKQIEGVVLALASIALITATQLAAINVLMGPAWSLAEAVSLFSFGANAVPAEVGISAVVAAGTAAQSAGKFERGGFVTGTPGIDRIPAFLTNGEFIVNAKATALNRSALEAINGGGSSSRSSSGGVGGGRMQVSIYHDGSTHIGVQQIDENTVRIIAKQEARSAVQTHAPNVISSEIYNPNSAVSKAVSRNVNAARKR